VKADIQLKLCIILAFEDTDIYRGPLHLHPFLSIVLLRCCVWAQAKEWD